MTTAQQPPSPTPHTPRPWWKYGHVWLVISGPLAVVVACVITGWIVLTHEDPLVDEDYYRHGLEVNKTLAAQSGLKSALPAMQGRNHAATPTEALRPADEP